MIEPAALPGVKLKAERERRGLSAQKAADEMHLDRWVIDALEADDYQRIGPTVYAKGHLKKYAALLGLPAAEIMSGFESRPQVRTEPVSAGPSMLLSTRGDSDSSGGLSPLQIAGLRGGGLGARPLVVASLARPRQGSGERCAHRGHSCRCADAGCRVGPRQQRASRAGRSSDFDACAKPGGHVGDCDAARIAGREWRGYPRSARAGRRTRAPAPEFLGRLVGGCA